MNKYPLIGGSICAVVLLVLASLTNVVGYQTVRISNQKIIASEVNQKDLLFQTIVNIANNKEMQRVILGSQFTGKRFFGSEVIFPTFKVPVITRQILKTMYILGLILFRTLDKSKIQTIIEHPQMINQGMQKEHSVVIEKDVTLKSEMTQLSNFSCGCENENAYTWHYPVVCAILYILDRVFNYLGEIAYENGHGWEWFWYFLMSSVEDAATHRFNCKW